jgi:hypothetical protein
MAASGRSHGTFGAYVDVVTADSTTRSSMHGEIHRQSKTLSMLKLPSPAGDGPHASQRGLRSIRPTRQTHPDLPMSALIGSACACDPVHICSPDLRQRVRYLPAHDAALR